MYTEYTESTYEDGESYIPQKQSFDISFGPGVNAILFAAWVVICASGLAVAFFLKMPILGGTIIILPTFAGMVIMPTFALSLMAFALPAGAGVGLGGFFSLGKGVGLAFALSFLLNMTMIRPKLHIGNKALWALIGYTVWVCTSFIFSPYPVLEIVRSFTQIQLLALVLIVYWVIEANGTKTLWWALRAYIVGSLGTIAVTFLTGTAITTMEEGRYRATLGGAGAVNANLLAAITAMALLAAIYLLIRDRRFLWRLLYLMAILVLPVILLRIGSRAILIGVIFTVMSPLLFLRQTLQRPALLIAVLLGILLAAGATILFTRQTGGIGEEVSERLTDIEYAKRSVSYRLSIDISVAKNVLKRPFGTTYHGWLSRAGLEHFPHNDLFFILGIYGIPGAAFFVLWVSFLLFTVKRMPMNLEKIYARALLTFVLVIGLSGTLVYKKYYWVFLAIIMCLEKIGRSYAEQGEIDQMHDEQYVEEGDFYTHVEL